MGYLHRPDVRWQGTQRHYFTAFAIKNLLLILFVILIIVEGVLYKSWRGSGSVEYAYGPYNFWARIGGYVLADALLTLVMAYFIHVNKWHPVAGLVFSIFWFGIWFCGMFFNTLLILSNEISFDNVDRWYELGYTEAGLQGAIAISYLVMMSFAAVAVHKLRITMRRSTASVVKKDGSEKSSMTV